MALNTASAALFGAREAPDFTARWTKRGVGIDEWGERDDSVDLGVGHPDPPEVGRVRGGLHCGHEFVAFDASSAR